MGELTAPDQLLSRAAAVPDTSAGKTYRLTIPLKPPTKNDIKPDMGILRMGSRDIPAAWIRVKRLEEKWAREIPWAAAFKATGPRRVRFTRVMGRAERRYDSYNLVAGLNAIVMDLLVHRGWLLDDRDSVCEQSIPVQRKAGPNELAPCTIIEFEDLETTCPG